MEFSGANEQSDKAYSNKFTSIALLVIGIIMFLLSLFIHDISPGFGIILIETLVVALCGAALEIYKAYNRGHSDYIVKFVKLFGVIAFTNIVIQLGGVYSHVSEPLSDKISMNNFQM